MAGAKSAGYKLATYKSSEGPRAGIIVGNDVFDAAKLTGKAGYATVMGILADWKAAEPALKKAAAGAAKSRAKRQPLSKTKLLAPLRFPSAIFGVLTVFTAMLPCDQYQRPRVTSRHVSSNSEPPA